MATKIVANRLPRWHGKIEEITEFSLQAQCFIKEKIGTAPEVRIKTTVKDVETHFDSLDDFTASMDGDFSKLQALTITVGDFDRDSPLSAEATFQTTREVSLTPAPAVSLRARGHDEAYVEWLARNLMKQLEPGRRRLPLTNTALWWIVLIIFMIAQYLFFKYITLPDMNDLAFYVSLIVVSFLPFLFCLAALKSMNWLVPQLELLPRDGTTRWHKYHRRAIAAVTALVGSIFVPLIVAVLQNQLGLG